MSFRSDMKNKHQPSPDLVKDVITPAVAAVGMLVSRDSPKRFVAFLAVALLFGTFRLWPLVREKFRDWRTRVANDTFATRESAKFRQFVHSFGEFVDNRTRDTLHAIVSGELSAHSREPIRVVFEVARIDIWSQFWYFLDQRASSDMKFDDFPLAVLEFNSLVNQYYHACVEVVFERSAQELRGRLSPDEISKLNGFQQRYQRFAAEYSRFLKSIALHPGLDRIHGYVPTPNPL